jgi:uncharacterized protein (TIGR00251 family)
MIAYRKISDGIIFEAFVQPRSSASAIVGIHDQALKIKLTSPPVGGAANKQCIQLLAKSLGLPKSAVSISSGHTSRRKKICIKPPADSQGRINATSIIDRLQALV